MSGGILPICFLLAALLSVEGSTLYVSSSAGTDGLGCGTASMPCSSIQFALTASEDANVGIVLEPGLYSESNLNITGKSFFLQGSNTSRPLQQVFHCTGEVGFLGVDVSSFYLSYVEFENCATAIQIQSPLDGSGSIFIESSTFRDYDSGRVSSSNCGSAPADCGGVLKAQGFSTVTINDVVLTNYQDGCSGSFLCLLSSSTLQSLAIAGLDISNVAQYEDGFIWADCALSSLRLVGLIIRACSVSSVVYCTSNNLSR